MDTAEISERLLLMKECADHVIAIGENKLYYIEKSPFQVTDISVCLKEPLEACLAENGRIAVISGSGLGVLYDEQLNIVSRFRLPAGSRITFISKQGYVGFAAPQGSNYIVATRNLPSGRVVYSHKNGAFVISPSGTAAILAGDNELSVIEGGTLYELLTRGEC